MDPYNGAKVVTVPIVNEAAGTKSIATAPGAQTRVYVIAVALFPDDPTRGATVKFTSGTGPTNLTGPMEIGNKDSPSTTPAASPLVMLGSPERPILVAALGEKLDLVIGTQPVSGFVTYYLAP